MFNINSSGIFILLEHISFCALYKSAINYVTEKQDSGASQKRISFLTEEEVNSVNKHYITVYIFASSIQITVNYRLKILTVENHIKSKGPVQFSHKYDFRSSSPAHIKNQSYVVVLCFSFFPPSGRLQVTCRPRIDHWQFLLVYTCIACIHVKHQIS